jgi:hypothetical protein
MADQVQAATGKPEKIRIDFAPSGTVTGGGKVTHLRRASFVDRLGDQIDGLSVLAEILVRADADGEHPLHRPDVLVALGWQGRRSFAQRRVERLGDCRAFERFQKIAAQQCHQLCGRKTERGNIAKAFHQSPTGLAVAPFDYKREPDCFQRFKIAPYRALVFRKVVRNVFDKFLEASPR